MARDHQHLLEMGARIKELRATHGYKQQWIADQVGVQLRTYQFWQEGKSPPGQENLEKLAELFKVEPRFILHGDAPDLLDTLDAPKLQALQAQLNRIEDNSRRLDQMEEALGEIQETLRQVHTLTESLGSADVLRALATVLEGEARATLPKPRQGRGTRR